MQQKDNSVAKLLSQINFKMGKKLGEGRFSIVKLGTHSLTGQPVAIKILDKTKIAKLEDKEKNSEIRRQRTNKQRNSNNEKDKSF